MKKNNKKGFTIVELVIVISVIAILAAVLIPTFSSIIKRANLSADQQAVRQMNTSLALYAVDKNVEDIDDVYDILAETGFSAENYTPLTSNTRFAWCIAENKVVLIENETDLVIYPAELEGREFEEGKYINFIDEEPVDPLNITASLNKENGKGFVPEAQAPDYNQYYGVYPSGEDYLEKATIYSFFTPDDGENPDYEAQREYFKGWIADFAIIPQDDFSAGSVGICGHYELYTHYTGTQWVSIILPEDVVAGQTILLMRDGLEMENFLTYETIIQACNMDIDENGKTDTFDCGAFNLSEENVGKKIVVELRLYETDDNGEKTGNYVVCKKVEYECY